MSNKMNINCGIPYVEELISGMLWGVNAAILSIALLREWRPKARVKESEDFTSVLQWLNKNEHHKQGVEGHTSEKNSPEYWMGSFLSKCLGNAQRQKQGN